MWLHGGVAPGKQFHTHARSGFQNFALRRAHQARIFFGGFKKRKNVGAIKAGDAPQSSDRRTHLSAFECTEKSHRHARRARHLGQRKTAARAQAPKTLAWHLRRIRRSYHYTLAL